MSTALTSMLVWVDKLPWPPLLLLGGMLALAPFVPEPHLVEKVRMLFQGTLKRLLDWFDLFYHLAPLLIIALKAGRQYAL